MRRLRPLLGTYVEIDADGHDERRLGGALDEAFAAVELVHRLMSPQLPDSDLSRVNRIGARRAVRVHPWTARTLRWALVMYDATGGLFDCATEGTLRDLQLLPDRAVRLARPTKLDLGGIAKGFAVDRAIAILRRRGVRSARVDAGGDLRVMGPAPRPIYLRDPLQDRMLRPMGLLANGAIATSGTRELIYRRRRATVDRRSYSVVAPRCVIADALTKAVAQTADIQAPWLARFGAVATVNAPLAEAA